MLPLPGEEIGTARSCTGFPAPAAPCMQDDELTAMSGLNLIAQIQSLGDLKTLRNVLLLLEGWKDVMPGPRKMLRVLPSRVSARVGRGLAKGQGMVRSH